MTTPRTFQRSALKAKATLKAKSAAKLKVKSKESLSNAVIRLGNEFRKLDTCDTKCPVYVCFLEDDLSFTLDSLPYTYDTSPTFTGFDSLPPGSDKVQPETTRAYWGLDCEFLTDEVKDKYGIALIPRLISHQFYFAHNGQRKGLVIMTSVRFTEDALIKFIAAATPPALKKVFLTAHFSYAECSWLRPGKPQIQRREKLRELKHCDPVEWLFRETKQVFEYEERHGERPTTADGFVARPKLLPIKTRGKKWVGSVGIYNKTELDEIYDFGKESITVTNKLTGKTRTTFVTIDHAKLVYSLVPGGKAAFEDLVRESIAGGRTKKKSRDEWSWIYDLRAECKKELLRLTGEKSVPKLPVRQLVFADSMDLLAGPLSSSGKLMGVKKITLNPGEIERMDLLFETAEERYVEYSMRDAVLTAEAIAFFGKKFWDAEQLDLHTRTTGYSATLFKHIFKTEVVPKTGPHRSEKINVKELLGWEHRIDEHGKELSAMWPSASMEAFALYYFGGWAACHAVGPRDFAVYHDLKSAYPSAICALKYDYNYGEPRGFFGKWATECVENMIEDGPFQVAGVACKFRFKNVHPITGRPVEPIFPVKVDQTWLPPMSIADAEGLLLFPRSGYAHVPWPEFYVAYTTGLLDMEHTSIDHVVTFQKLPGTSKLAAQMMRLLGQRGKLDNKATYKGLLNFFYGRSCEGIGKKSVLTKSGVMKKRRLPGPLTCFPLAAYTTSICRATVGEVIQKHDCYGIATDGIMSPDRYVTGGEITNKIHEMISVFADENVSYVDSNGNTQAGWKDDNGVVHSAKPYEYVENEFTAKQSLFIKTRGYALIGDEKDAGKIKMAQMGIQINERDKKSDAALTEFLGNLNALTYTKKSRPSLDDLLKPGNDAVPTSRKSKTRIKTTYDFKRLPIAETIQPAEFSHAGVTHNCVSFDTAPLENVETFVMLRQLARGHQQLDADGYKALLRKLYQTGFGNATGLY